jgi:nucleoside-diphosphate-sugar epimerase
MVPITEDHPLAGQSPYSASKIGADAMAEAYHRAFGVPVAVVRPFNTFGPRQSTRAILPTVVGQALLGGPLSLGSLDPVRDLTFVTDTARGMMMCGLADACVGVVTNLGTGSGLSVAQMVETVGEVLGRRLEVRQDPARVRPAQSEVVLLISANQRARERAGWSPLVPFAAGLKLLVDDMRAHPERYEAADHHV